MSELLVPHADEDGAPFWEAAAREELRIQACASCERLRFPPRPFCPWCRSPQHEWRLMSGRGRIWSFVVTHPPLLPAYAELAPYNVCIVALDEDETIRLVGNVVASEQAPINSVDPATIEIGMPVRVVFQAIAGGVALPRWVRA
jgi:uncharacterized OB-fold protein